jgi:hypothetical protein
VGRRRPNGVSALGFIKPEFPTLDRSQVRTFTQNGNDWTRTDKRFLQLTGRSSIVNATRSSSSKWNDSSPLGEVLERKFFYRLASTGGEIPKVTDRNTCLIRCLAFLGGCCPNRNGWNVIG